MKCEACSRNLCITCEHHSGIKFPTRFFTRKNNLRRHLLIHAGAEAASAAVKYTCRHCRKTFESISLYQGGTIFIRIV